MNHKLLSLCVHTCFALLCLEPDLVADCDARVTPYHRMVLGAMCIWYGYELSQPQTAVLRTHHCVTLFAALTAYITQTECSGYVIYRATVLAEPLVDLFQLLRGTGHALEDLVSVLFTLCFFWTRGWMFFRDATLPTFVKIGSQLGGVAGGCVRFIAVGLQTLQWVWCVQILKGARKKFKF